jgi:hypothetical protein
MQAPTPQKAKSFWKQLWAHELNEFFQHFLVDMVKSLSILSGLVAFRAAIFAAAYFGVEAGRLRSFEDVHFTFMWIAIATLSLMFVSKIAIVAWKGVRATWKS